MWVHDDLKNGTRLSFEVKNVLYEGTTNFQAIKIVETTHHGKLLILDGIFMFTEKDEFIYHEMLNHVPLCCIENPKKVLVIGGGDGGSVREILKHNVEEVTLVEIDGMVVDLCKKYIPSVSRKLEDPRVKVVIDDGIKFVKNNSNKYDVIIVDSTDPIGPSIGLFEKSFYDSLSKCLSDNGIMIFQAECPFSDKAIQKEMYNNLSNFKHRYFYTYPTLSYPEALWSFLFVSNTHHPFFDIIKFDSYQYYNTNIHRAAFSLPTFMGEENYEEY